MLPSLYVEVGWSLYENAEPDEYNRVLSVMCENTQSPHWNQELLLNNPPELLDMSGYVWLIFRDKNNNNQIVEKVVIPLFGFRAFQPVHLEIVCGGKRGANVKASA